MNYGLMELQLSASTYYMAEHLKKSRLYLDRVYRSTCLFVRKVQKVRRWASASAIFVYERKSRRVEGTGGGTLLGGANIIPHRMHCSCLIKL